MATLRDIKQRMVGVANTAKITQAMRMVSAAKLRRAQNAIWSARPYVLKLSEVLTNLVESVGEEYSNPLVLKHKEIKNITVIVVASDRGLCGSFNNNLFRIAANYLEIDAKKENPNASVSVIVCGKKSAQFFKKQPYDIKGEYINIYQPLEFSTAKDIVNKVKDDFIKGKTDKVVIFFNEFKNIITQVPSSIQLLPIEHKQEDEKSDEKSEFNIDYIFEPNQAEILDNLLPTHLDIQMWRTMLESNAAEQAARMMAMENATINAKELIKHLEMIYNRERQAAITTEMLEIVSGANALQK